MINHKLFAIIPVCFILFFTGISCKQKIKPNEIPTDFTLKKFMLQDSLAEIEIYLPNELDTFFQWMDESDNACDDYERYRFADKKYSPIAETGFFKEHADSVYQLTVSHINNYRCITRIRSIDSVGLGEQIEHMKEFHRVLGDSFLMFTAQIRNYDNYPFAVMVYSVNDNYSGKRLSVYLDACTIIDSSYIGFDYHTNGAAIAGFTNRMLQSISTVKIRRRNAK
jgi:hypothetical protein